MDEEDIKKSIKKLGEKFENNPLNFTVESSLVAELQSIMREKNKNNGIQVNAEYKDFDEEKYEENYTNYKEKYLKRICNQSEINQIQMEVNIGEPWKDQGEGKNKLIDLAVLKDKTEIRLIKGTKYFLPESIEHAIEIKFIKNKNIAPKNVEKFFKRDVDKLENLEEADSKHLIIFSNKNIFQKRKNVENEINEKDKRNTEDTQEIYDDIKENLEDTRYTGMAQNRFKELNEDDKCEGVEIYHYFPLINSSNYLNFILTFTTLSSFNFYK